MLARSRRLCLLLIVLAAMVAPGARGLCFMPGIPAGTQAEHGCCGSGLTAAPPSCCMEVGRGEVPAIRVATHVATTLGVMPALLLRDEHRLRLRDPHATASLSFHSPPIVLVLRV